MFHSSLIFSVLFVVDAVVRENRRALLASRLGPVHLDAQLEQPCVLLASRARSQFARLLAIGVAAMFFANGFVNIAMVTGLLPVVGEPLPLMSLGGSAMIATLTALGLAMSAFVGRDRPISRSGEDTV